jgi:hypothetical protein
MQDRDWSRLIAMRQVIVVGARTDELLAESALHRGLHWRLAIFRDVGLSFPIHNIGRTP